MSKKSFSEKNLLAISVVAAVLFALVGIVWGVLISSQIILFDGAYSLVSVCLSLLSLIALRYIHKSDARRFPYGKERLEPIVIIFKYAIIFLLCIAALASAVESLLSGGREVNVGHALVFAALSTAGCAAVYVLFRRQRGRSGFVQAEANQWKMDTLLSSAVLLGFGLAWLVAKTPFDSVMPYIDPLMVLLVVGFFLKTPIQEIAKAAKEVMEMSAGPSIETEFEKAMRAIEARYEIPDSILRVAKVGDKLFVDIDFILGPQSKTVTTADQDAVRAEITRLTEAVAFKKWLTVSFTHEAKWAKRNQLNMN